MIKDFRDLEVWKKGMEIVKSVYTLTSKFPAHELYGLTSQLRRAAVSVPSNIAEGFNRKHNKEYRQFLYLALGSCAALETQLEIAHDLQYLDQGVRDTHLEMVQHESKMLTKLIARIATSNQQLATSN